MMAHGYKEEEGHWLTSVYWQQQLQLAQLSRQTNSAHIYARSAVVASRAPNESQVPITVADLASKLIQTQPTPISTTNGGNAAGRPQTPGKPTSASSNANPQQQKKDQIEEERQRHINEDIKKQFWTAIDLSGQGLVKIAPKLFNYSFLQKLYLNHNKLEQIPPAISNLTQLKVLDLSGNLLTELPPEMGVMYTLRYLFLFDNRLVNLPYEFGMLFQLEILGIEGNPINDHTRELMAKQGTRGVIIDLRERAPVTIESPARKWLDLEEQKTPSGNGPNPNKFSVMSYNILADNLAASQLFAYTPSRALEWQYRQDLISKEIATIDSDIICLQEADQSAYDYWLQELSKKGYLGQYWPKSRARTMDGEERKKVDGCAIYYRSSKFQLVEKCPVEYNTLALRKDDFKRTDDIYNRVMNKDNVALMLALERVTTPEDEEPLEGPPIFILATTHLLWNPAFSDVKVVQVALLMEEIQRFADKHKTSDMKKVPVIIAGDFNSTPDSAVYQLFATGKCPPTHPEMNSRVYGKYTEEGMSHKLSLRSAFADVGELPFTNFTPSFVEQIDHMWYTTQTLQVDSILQGIDEEYVRHFVAFPNVHHPSDHIPIAAKFEFKKQKEAVAKPPPPNFYTAAKK